MSSPLAARLVPALALLLAGPLAAEAAEAPSRLAYTVSLSGLPLARADVAVSEPAGRYDLAVAWRTAGLANVFAAAKGTVTASGRLDARGPSASSFHLAGGSDAAPVDVRLGLAGGAVGAAAVAPPADVGGGRVELTPAHKRGVVDPLSAVLLPWTGAPERLCDRTVAVYDGWTRWDVRLTPKATRTDTPAGFDGPVVVCAARWIPVAGHRPTHGPTRDLAANTDIEVALAHPGGRSWWLPIEVSVGTKLGTARLAMTEAAFAPAPTPPKRPPRSRG